MKPNIKKSVFTQTIRARPCEAEREAASNVQVDMLRVVPGKSINRGTPAQESGNYAWGDSTPWTSRIRTGLRFKSTLLVRD